MRAFCSTVTKTMRRSLLTVTTTWNSPRSALRRSIVQAAVFGLECLTNLIFDADSSAETRASTAGDVCACSQVDAVTMPITAAPVAMASRIRGVTSFLLTRTIHRPATEKDLPKRSSGEASKGSGDEVPRSKTRWAARSGQRRASRTERDLPKRSLEEASRTSKRVGGLGGEAPRSILVPRGRIELPTLRFSVVCSTN